MRLSEAAIPALLSVSLSASPLMAQAQDCSSIENAGERLACYDLQAETACEIEDWNASEYTAERIRIVGATSCQEGRMTYRLYSGDDFITAGVTFIDGFAFIDFPMISEVPD